MPYVQRDKNGNIIEAANRRQRGRAEEYLPDDDAELVAFLKLPEPPDFQGDLEAAIAAATTIEELKAALLGQARVGKVAGRPV